MTNDTTKPNEPSFKLSHGKLSSKTSSFKQRINEVRSQSEAIDPQTMPNRICLMLDCSGSMDSQEDKGQRRIDLLKEAVQNFISRCSFADTSLAIVTFPYKVTLPLSSNSSTLIGSMLGLEPGGGTPLHACVTQCLTDVAMTRGVIVSDGGATDWRESYSIDDPLVKDQEVIIPSVLQLYKEQHIPLDCVHISSGTDGEELLRRIARETGGIFIKFTDVSAFSRAFGYLAPGYRAMLTSGAVTAKQLGAKEIK